MTSEGTRAPDTTTRVPPNLARWDEYRFWEACLDHRLELQRCDSCARFRFQPRPYCPWCASADHTWVEVSGRGTVYTYTICHPPVLPQFADEVPYNAVVVELEEGPFMVSNLVECEDGDLRVGLPVEVTFLDLGDDVTIPQFRPADG